MTTPYSYHLAELILTLFKQKPFTVFFRILVLTFAVQHHEFWYLILFFTGAGLWIIESVALYIDPLLANHPLIRLANFLFVVLAISAALLHFAPHINETVETVEPLMER